MVDIKKIISDPNFLSLDDAEKIKVMSKVDTNFSMLQPQEQIKVVSRFSSTSDNIPDQQLPQGNYEPINVTQDQMNQGMKDYTKPISTLEFGKQIPKDPGERYEIGKQMLEGVITPTVELAGTTAGGFFGSPVVGSALGYAASKKIMDLVEDYYAQLGGAEPKKRTYGGELADTAKDVALVAATGKAFEIAAPAISSGIKKSGEYFFDTLPKRMYAQSVNAPMSKKWIEQLRGKEISKRTLAIEEGLKESLPPNKLSIAKVDKLRREAWNHIEESANVLSQDPNNKIATEDMARHARNWATSKPRTKSELETIEGVISDLKTYGEYITPKQALDIKTELYKKTPIGDPKSGVKDLTKEGAANYLMKTLEKMDKGFKSTNETYFARSSLKDILEKSVAQQEKQASVGLGTKILLVHKWPLALFNETMGHPAVRSRMALVLAKGNPTKYSKFIYPDMPAGYKPPVKKIETEVFKDLVKIRKMSNQKLIDAGYQETAGLSKGLELQPKIRKPLGSDTISAARQDFTKSTAPKIKTTLRPGEKKVDIKTQSQLRKEADEAAIEKAVDMAFARQASMKASKGSPLSMPRQDFAKSTAPKIKITLRPAELKSAIKNKVAERIEKEEAIRVMHLEKQFEKQAASQKTIGPPLIMPKNEFAKSKIPMSVEDRLKGL